MIGPVSRAGGGPREMERERKMVESERNSDIEGETVGEEGRVEKRRREREMESVEWEKEGDRKSTRLNSSHL